MSPSATLSAPGRFALIVKGLCEAVAARIAARTMTGELIRQICDHIHRIDNRFQALVAQLRAGTLRVGHSGPHCFNGRQPPKLPPLPRGFAWLIALVPQHAAGRASQLQYLLSDPEMADLIANPRVASTLRPLCRMLGLPRHLLPPPPPRPKPQPAAVEEPPAPEPACEQKPPPPPEPPEAAQAPPPLAAPEPTARDGPEPSPFSWLFDELRAAAGTK